MPERATKLFSKNFKKGLDILQGYVLGYDQARGKRLDLHRKRKGGDSMTVLEIFALLNLLAVVIFGVLNAKK